MRKLLVIFVSLMLCGCASVQYNRLTKEQLPRLDSSNSAYVLVPDNAMYYGKECIGSGTIVCNLIYSAFSKHLKRVEMAPNGEKFEEGFKKAKNLGFTYLVDSKIFQWEDYVTEWNGRLDRIDIQIDLFETKASNLIDSVNFKGNGTWFTFGGYHPQHIVAKSIDDYVNSYFSLGAVDKIEKEGGKI
jgi:hypothetical protein